jgi:hypothetical protein
MPGWLTAALKWGGIVLTILMATALVYLEIFPRTSGDEASAVPVTRYWVGHSASADGGIPNQVFDLTRSRGMRGFLRH